MTTVLLAWLRAFLLTELVEGPIYRYGYGARWPIALGASAITHPLVWLLYGVAGEALSYAELLVIGETFAWLAEAAFLRATTRRDATLLWAFVANAASVAVGMLTRALTGYP